MRADCYDSLPAAGIVEREELALRQYRGLNPAFVRKVWAKRRSEAGRNGHGAGGRSNKWTDDEREAIRGYILAGLSKMQIGLKFGVSKGAISGLIHRDPVLSAAFAARRTPPPHGD